MESGTGCLSRRTQARCFIPQPKIGKGEGGKRGTHGHFAVDPLRRCPSWGQGGRKSRKGAAASGLCLRLRCTGELAFPSAQKAGRESKDVREAPAPAGHSHWTVSEQGGDLPGVSGGGCSQRCSCWFCPILFPLRAFSSTRVWVSKRCQPCTVSPALLFIQSLLGQPEFQKSRFFSDSKWYNLRARPVSLRPWRSPSSPGCPAWASQRDIPSF